MADPIPAIVTGMRDLEPPKPETTIETGLDTPEKQKEVAAFNLVDEKIGTMLKNMGEKKDMTPEWADFLTRQQPFLRAILQLAQEPEVQQRVTNLSVITENFKQESPVVGWEPLNK